jgi:hypothetical protein
MERIYRLLNCASIGVTSFKTPNRCTTNVNFPTHVLQTERIIPSWVSQARCASKPQPPSPGVPTNLNLQFRCASKYQPPRLGVPKTSGSQCRCATKLPLPKQGVPLSLSLQRPVCH